MHAHLETLQAIAANGHLMTYRVTGVDPDGTPRLSQWDAEHSDRCPCQAAEDAEPLPDF